MINSTGPFSLFSGKEVRQFLQKS